MFIPAIIEQNQRNIQTLRLGHMVYRLRLPKYAQAGSDLLAEDANLVHFVEDVNAPVNWLNTYLVRVREEVPHEA